MAALSQLVTAEVLNALRAAHLPRASAERALARASGKLLLIGQAAISLSAFPLVAIPLGEHLELPAPVVSRILAELAQLALLLAAVGLPLAFSGAASHGSSPPPSSWTRWPIPRRQLAVAAVVRGLVSGWVPTLAGMAALAALPLLRQPHRWTGLAAATLLLAEALLLGAAVDLVTSSSASTRTRRALGLAAALALAGCVLVPALWPLTVTANGLELRGPSSDVLLVARNGHDGLVPGLLRALPPSAVLSLAARSPAREPAVVLGFSLLIAAVLAGLAARHALAAAPAPRSAARPWWPRVPGLRDPLRALVEAELRSHLSTLDAPLGVLLGLAAALALAWAPGRDALLALALLPAILLLESALVLNAFGLDRGAVARLLLAPVPARSVLVAKALAFAVTATVQLALPLVVLGLRHGAVLAATVTCGLAALACALAARGALASISHAAPRVPWGLETAARAGGVASQALAVVLTLGLVAAGLAASRADAALGSSWVLPSSQAAAAAVAALTLVASLRRAARQLPSRGEELREKLSA